MNDAILIEFLDREISQGIAPAQIVSISSALTELMMACDSDRSSRDDWHLVVWGVHEGSIKLWLGGIGGALRDATVKTARSAKKELAENPIRATVALGALGSVVHDVARKVLSALVASGTAIVQPPAQPSDLKVIKRVDRRQEAACDALSTALRQVDRGAIILYFPGQPGVRMADLDARTVVIHGGAHWMTAPDLPFQGAVSILEDVEPLWVGDLPTPASIGTITTGVERKTKRVLILWISAVDNLTRLGAASYSVDGTLYRPSDGAERLNLRTTRPRGPASDFGVDAILFVRNTDASAALSLDPAHATLCRDCVFPLALISEVVYQIHIGGRKCVAAKLSRSWKRMDGSRSVRAAATSNSVTRRRAALSRFPTPSARWRSARSRASSAKAG